MTTDSQPPIAHGPSSPGTSRIRFIGCLGVLLGMTGCTLTFGALAVLYYRSLSPLFDFSKAMEGILRAILIGAIAGTIFGWYLGTMLGRKIDKRASKN
jgi:hypothetical protein